MTEKTKQIFYAPWNVKHHVHACWEVDFEVSTTNGMSVAVSPTEEHANRLARLPELFAYLLDRVYYDCSTCYCKNTGFLLQQTMDEIIDAGCPLKRKFCDTNAVFKLLMEVRDGKIVNKELKK